MRPGTYVLLITSPLSAGLNYLFVYTFKMGLLGAPLATGIAYWASFLLLLAYARFVDGWQCWGGWDRKCLQNLWTFSRLALLGVIHVGTEWWAFEIVALVAGKLGTIPLAAQSVIMTTDQVMNTIPFGVGVATSSRVTGGIPSRSIRSPATTCTRRFVQPTGSSAWFSTRRRTSCSRSTGSRAPGRSPRRRGSSNDGGRCSGSGDRRSRAQ